VNFYFEAVGNSIDPVPLITSLFLGSATEY
jgi:hypothetical protein